MNGLMNLPIRPVTCAEYAYVMAYLEIQRRPIKMSQVGYGCCNAGGGWTSTSAILVLFILLVIITKSFWL
jgi:uncharacterized protein (TIGR01732 family)